MSDTRTGLVESIEETERGTWKAVVGGRSVRFWPTEYGTDQPSEVLEMLQAAKEQGESVEVTGKEEERKNAAGKPYTAFTAKSVRLSPNGSQSPSDGPGGQKGHPLGYSGRDPGLADYWQAWRWAFSTAVDVLGQGKAVLDYEVFAKELFDASFHNAERDYVEAQGVSSDS